MLGPLEHGSADKGKTEKIIRAQSTALIAPGEAIPFGFALAACAGAGLYLLLPFEPNFLVCLGLLLGAALVLAVVSMRASVAPLRLVAILAFGISLGVFAGKARVMLNGSVPQHGELGPVLVEGWLSGIESGRNGVRLRIKTHAVAGHAPEETAKIIRLTHRLDLRVSSGRFIRCWAVLRPPPGPALPGDYDFQRQAWFDRLDAVGYVMGRCRGGVLGAPAGLGERAALTISSLRRQLARYVYATSGERAGGFSAALISGDRSYISAADQDALRGAGLAHLLAISGLHLGIVGGLVYLLFRRGLGLIEPLARRFAIQKPAAIAAILAITAYLVLSGASVSTQRAYIMAVVFFSAILFDRPALSLRSFSLAMILVVLLRPESVLSPGFQMSFAATGVLIAIYEAWSRKRSRTPRQFGVGGRAWVWAQSLAVTSIAASIATAPFAFYHFERLAPLGLVANLAAMPVVSLASVPAAGATMMLAPFGLSDLGLRAFGGSLEIVLAISHWASASGAQFAVPVKSMPPEVLLVFTISLASFVLFRRWLRLLSTAATALGATALWMLLPAADGYWSPSGEAYLKLDDGGRYTVVSIAKSDALGPLRIQSVGTEDDCMGGGCVYTLSGGQTVAVLTRAPLASDCRQEEAPFLILVSQDEEKDGARTSGDEQDWPCPNVLSWLDIQRLGGARFHFEGHQVRIKHVTRCSARPWRHCRS